MKNVLVTGGAGYIGSVLVRLLLEEGYRVTVLDSLMFGGQGIFELLNNSNFTFVRGDVRNENLLDKLLSEVQFVVHLAAIVGDPACAKSPDLARSINLDGSILLYNAAERNNVERFIFASTCSNYGKMASADQFVDEQSELSPVSLYAETKVEFEKYLMSKKREGTRCVPTCLRFSTVYGISPRLRFDLTVNEFSKELALGRELIIFGQQFWRPYCHVLDLSRSVVIALSSSIDKVGFSVFNVGDTNENYQKKMIVDEILKVIPSGKVKYVTKNEDPRDYRVSFEKINSELNFQVVKRVPDGIKQILDAISSGLIVDPDALNYKNV